MSYYKKSDVKNHLSTRIPRPLYSVPQRTDVTPPSENSSAEVKVDTPDTAAVIPFRPIAKEDSSEIQVGDEVGLPNGPSRPKQSQS